MIGTAFADPARDGARAFRAVLEAISHPGRIQPFTAPLAAPEGFPAGMAAFALALCDYQTPIWLSGSFRRPEIERHLVFHTGAPLASDPRRSAFAFALVGEEPGFDALDPGTDEYPDRSATLIIAVDSLVGTDAARLTGPGIKRHVDLSAPPLEAAFWNAFGENGRRFPLGIDVFLVAPGAIAALPRSTRVELLDPR